MLYWNNNIPIYNNPVLLYFKTVNMCNPYLVHIVFPFFNLGRWGGGGFLFSVFVMPKEKHKHIHAILTIKFFWVKITLVFLISKKWICVTPILVISFFLFSTWGNGGGGVFLFPVYVMPKVNYIHIHAMPSIQCFWVIITCQSLSYGVWMLSCFNKSATLKLRS